MNRRENLIASVIGPELDETKAKMLDATLKLILGDMGEQYCKHWELSGPGIMVFQPEHKDRTMFYWLLSEIHKAQEIAERENNGDLAETFRRILESAQKINPVENAGYVINDNKGIRYFQIDYNKTAES